MTATGPSLDLSVLNHADNETAAAILLPFVERAPELASKLASRRPFGGPEELCGAVYREIVALPASDMLALFRGHPELAPSHPAEMTEASQAEQGRLGLTAPAPAIGERLAELNRRYSARFGFPFIVALCRVPDLDTLFQVFEMRLAADTPAEIAATCNEIALVSRTRILAAIECSTEVA